jgi:adenosylmethionine-8-amino-7-oxononanoate aminotransferase
MQDGSEERSRRAGVPDQEVVKTSLAPEDTKMFPMSFDEYPELVDGDGIYLYDGHGNDYLDATAGSMCCNIGHGVEEVAEAAFEQMRTLEYTTPFLTVSDQSRQYADELAAFLPDGFERTFMVSGGSEAVETAIKMARQYHLNTGNPEKHVVIGCERSYHGMTLGALSATGVRGRRRPFMPMLQNWPKAPAPYPYRCSFCENAETCRDGGTECAKRLEEVVRDAGPEYVSAFIVEPIAGGARTNSGAVPGDEYFEVVREICDEYDILMIADEIITGMGRTGENFAMEHWDVDPDVFVTAKGMSAGYTPLGGAMPQDHVVEAFTDDDDDGFAHGHTFSFHPVSSAIARTVLDYVRRNDLVGNAADVGAYLHDRAESLYEYDFVGDVRGKGLMLGVEFVEDRETKAPLEAGGSAFRDELLATAMSHGLVVWPGGGGVDGDGGDCILLTPPLTITRSQVDELMARLHATFDVAERSLV